MTEKPKWPKKKSQGSFSDIDKRNYGVGYNDAINQCNACVDGITEEEFEYLVEGECSKELYTRNVNYKFLAAAIVKHIKERLS